MREEEEGRGRAGARPARGREGGGGEGERWAALAPGGAPRGSRARARCAPPTTLSQWKWTRVHLGPRPSWVPAASRTHAVPAVRGRLLSGPRALAGNSGDDRVSSSGAIPGASRHGAVWRLRAPGKRSPDGRRDRLLTSSRAPPVHQVDPFPFTKHWATGRNWSPSLPGH